MKTRTMKRNYDGGKQNALWYYYCSLSEEFIK